MPYFILFLKFISPYLFSILNEKIHETLILLKSLNTEIDINWGTLHNI